VKLKLDENIPQSAATRLTALGYDVDTVLDESSSVVEATKMSGPRRKPRTASS
jgi:hypothetical protein